MASGPLIYDFDASFGIWIIQHVIGTKAVFSWFLDQAYLLASGLGLLVAGPGLLASGLGWVVAGPRLLASGLDYDRL